MRLRKQATTHEDFSRETEVRGSSNRVFGLVFAAVFLVVGLRPYLSARPPRLWAIAIGGVFLLVSMIRPGLLAPLNRAWLRIGLVMQRVMNPVVMGFLFFSTVTPLAFIMRLLGKDPLRLKWEPAARSYWIERKKSDLAPESMRHQF